MQKIVFYKYIILLCLISSCNHSNQLTRIERNNLISNYTNSIDNKYGGLVLQYALDDKSKPHQCIISNKYHEVTSFTGSTKELQNKINSFHSHKLDEHKVLFYVSYLKNIVDQLKLPKVRLGNNNLANLKLLNNLVTSIPLLSPLPNYVLTSKFNNPKKPNKTRKHLGVDLQSVKSKKIIAAAIGRVSFAGKKNNYGNLLIIDHGNKYTTLYAHLAEIYLKQGDLVKVGELIALEGNTGRSTNHHLHYEIRHGNIPINPLDFMKFSDNCKFHSF